MIQFKYLLLSIKIPQILFKKLSLKKIKIKQIRVKFNVAIVIIKKKGDKNIPLKNNYYNTYKNHVRMCYKENKITCKNHEAV